MMHTVYMGGLMAANHSAPRLRPVASMAACCASSGSGVMAVPSPSGAIDSGPLLLPAMVPRGVAGVLLLHAALKLRQGGWPAAV